MKPKRVFEADLATLELTQGAIEAMLNSIPEGAPDTWTKRTEAFHELVRTARKTQLKLWHPDVCKDPQAHEKAAEINNAADGLLTLRLHPIRRQPQFQVVILRGGGWGGLEQVWSNDATSNTWTSTGGGFWPGYGF